MLEKLVCGADRAREGGRGGGREREIGKEGRKRRCIIYGGLYLKYNEPQHFNEFRVVQEVSFSLRRAVEDILSIYIYK